jgi:subtilase family serine protease
LSHSAGRRSTIAAAAVLGLGAAGLITATTAQAANNARHTIGPAAPWAAANAKHSSAVSSSRTVHLKVWLGANDAARLTQLAAAVSNPKSASYGKYLSEAQYRAQFAPTGAQVASVESWLKGSGLQVEGVGPDNHFVAVAGGAKAVDAALGAGLRQFAVDGVTVLGPTKSASVPSSVSANVLSVTGLDTLAHNVTPASSEPDVPGHTNNGHRVQLGAPAGFVNAGPCSSYYGEKTDMSDPLFQGQRLAYAPCGYTPSQLRDVYGVTASGKTGAGVTVAITDAFEAPTLEKDANTYASRHGDAPFAKGQFSRTTARGYDPQRVADCGGNAWYGEQALDVEAVHGMAPDAGVAYYGATSCYDDDLMASLAQAVVDDKASLVTNSWGEPNRVVVDGVTYPTISNDLAAAYEAIFKQGDVQGIGFYFSSGDSGDDDAAWGIKGTDYPTSDPFVTSVGGTALGINRDGTREFETGWGTEKYSLTSGDWKDVGFLYGAGGGCAFTGTAQETSFSFLAKPSYQSGVATGCDSRGVPDISMDADPNTGMLVGETQSFGAPTVWGQGVKYGEYRIGGTSLASPLTAGLNAVAQQGRSRIGFANPVLYDLAKTSNPFYDVKPEGPAGDVRVDNANGLNAANGLLTSVRTFDQDSSLTTGKGWDQVSGLGSPTASYIAAMNAATR